MLRAVLILVLLMVHQAALLPDASAQSLVDRHRGRDDDGREGRKNRSQLSLDEAVQMAQRRYKARAVKAEIDSDGEHRIYVIRLLNDSGRVWTVRVNAETGSMR